MKYTVIFEKSPTSWGAYAPDLPGCGVAAETKKETTELIKEAIKLHVESLKEAGEEIPEPIHFAEIISV